MKNMISTLYIGVLSVICTLFLMQSSTARIADTLNLTELQQYRGRHYSIDDLCAIGTSLARAGMYQESLDYLLPALSISPDSGPLNWTTGDAYLALGNVPLGLDGFAYRWKNDARFNELLHKPDEYHGKRVLVAYQWHMVNTMLVIRYMRLLKESGATVLLEVPQEYGVLVQQCPYVDRVVSTDEVILKGHDYDVVVPALYLPVLFETTIETVPANAGSLIVDESYKKAWFTIVGQARTKAYAVGVFVSDQYSDYLLELLKKSLDSDIYVFNASSSFASPIFNNTGIKTVGLSDYADFSAFIQQLDIVITSDNFTALCADALGVLTCSIVEPIDDWYWLTDTFKTPWCSSAYLFRRASWQDVSVIRTLCDHIELINRFNIKI
jgi:hypothetical protein